MRFKEFNGSLIDIISREESCTFLVGAGISMDPPANLPSARELCKVLLSYCVPKTELTSVLGHKDLRYELVIENIQTYFNHNFKFMDYFELVNQPNFIHFFLASNILRGQYVITTNFDYFLEYAIMNLVPKKDHCKIIPIITREDFIQNPNPQLLFNQDLYPLYKIHGSKRNIINRVETVSSLITTMSSLGKNRDKEKTFAIETYKKPAVNFLMQNRTLIVMGYSGLDDFDIGPVLKELPNLKKIIWIDHNLEKIPKIYQLFDSESTEPICSNISHVDQLLFEIKNKNYEIFKIQAHTLSFIEKYLAVVLTPEIAVNIVKSESKLVPTFSDWVKPIYDSIREIDKYHFCTQLYYDLKDINQAISSAKLGLKFKQSKSDATLKSFFYNILGLCYRRLGNYSYAKKCIKKSLKIDQRSHSFNGELISTNDLAVIYEHEGNLKKALSLHLSTLKIADKLEASEAEYQCATIFNNIGLIYLDFGEMDKAFEYYSKALEIESKTGDLETKISTLINLGEYYRRQSEWNNAEDLFIEATKISEQIGDIASLSIALNNLGLICDSRENPDKALEYYTRAMKISEILHDPESKANHLNNIACIYKDRGELDKSMDLYSESIEIYQSLNNLSGIQICTNNIAGIYCEKNELDIAISKFKEALDIAEKLNDKSLQAVIFNNLGLIYKRKNEYDKALKLLMNALNIDEEIHDLDGQSCDINNIASLFEQKGDHLKSLEFYQKALSINKKLDKKNSVEIDLGKIEEIKKKII